MIVKIWLKNTSLPLDFDDVRNAYVKGTMYCIIQGKYVTKIPLDNILYVKEEYTQHLRDRHKGDV